jgi:uncharacterized membrane protein
MYLAWKLCHVLAVALFIGNIVTGLYWKAHAERREDHHARVQALDGIIGSDRWFTIPGVLVITASGIVMALMARWPLLRTGWIGVSTGLFCVSGVLFAAQVAPLQRQMLKVAQVAADGGRWDQPRYSRLSRRWEVWGILALLLPLGAFALMVIKPF